MRIIIIFFCLLNTVVAKSQKIINNINTVEKGVFSGNTTINRVDSIFIGQVIINQKNTDSIYFMGSVTVYDTTTQYYTTVYTFIPRTYDISFGVDIIISFDKPFTPWYITNPPPPHTIVFGRTRDIYRVNAANGEPHSSNLHTEDFKIIRVRGTITGDNLTISVKSKEKLYSKIESVYGAIGRK
jgi:hypothetical protein